MAMKFPQYRSTTERTVSVVGMVDKNNEGKERGVFLDGKGYIDEDENIWIYCGAGKPKNANAYPYFWLNEEGEKEFSEPQENMKKAFNVTNMKDMSLQIIVEKTGENEELFDEDAINDMNAAAAFYVPQIRESDDFLKKVVKNTIIAKGIDINRLKVKTEQKYILPNMKAALDNKTKMSVMYFCCWMELLGCDFQVSICDNGTDDGDPLKNTLIYISDKDKVYRDVNGELIECTSGTTLEEEEDNE